MNEIDVAQSFTRSELEVIPEGELLSNAHRDIYQGIRDMKLSKIRLLQAAVTTGELEADVATGIVGTLSMDVAICDALLCADFGSADSVAIALGLIKSIVAGSPRPGSEEVYVKTLNENELSMEMLYGKIVAEIQAKMKAPASD